MRLLVLSLLLATVGCGGAQSEISIGVWAVGVLLALFVLYLVIVTLSILGTLVFSVVNHLHQLHLQENLRIYDETKEFMLTEGTNEEENPTLYKWYINRFDAIRGFSYGVRKSESEENEDFVSVVKLSADHWSEKRESMQPMEVPSNLAILWYGFVGLCCLTLLVVLFAIVWRTVLSG